VKERWSKNRSTGVPPQSLKSGGGGAAGRRFEKGCGFKVKKKRKNSIQRMWGKKENPAKES